MDRDKTAASVRARSLRLHRDWLIAEIESGKMGLAELRDADEHDVRVATIKVVSIAQAFPGVGKLQARRVMADLGIPSDARWGELDASTAGGLWKALERCVAANR